MSIGDYETPSSDELLAALSGYLLACGVPAVVASLLDHLMCLYSLEMMQPELYWIGDNPIERAERHNFELSQLRSIIALEMAALGSGNWLERICYLPLTV